MYTLPTVIDIHGTEYEIVERGDYRAILDVIAALNNPDLREDGMFGNERAICAGEIFYPEWDTIEDKREALSGLKWFIDLGNEAVPKRHSKPLYDWHQDQHMIASAVGKVYGQSIRAIDYLHWWDFMAAFYEVGEGHFSFVCGIRNKIQRGKKLEKHEREFYSKNPEIINLRTAVSEEEQAMIDALMA